LKIAGALAWRDAGLSKDGRGAVGALWVGVVLAGLFGAGVWAAASRLAQRTRGVRKAFMRNDYTKTVNSEQ
jgi:uncharacterized membrane protein YedE/YeeE